MTTKKPWEMTDDDEYCEFVRMQPTAEEAIKLALRESRFVTYWFPSYSSGAGDMIDSWIRDMKTDWENSPEKPEL